jgi:hypothetical protein
VGSSAANAGDPTARGAAAVRTKVSAIASQSARTNDSGERIRIGREPGTPRACAVGGKQAASSCSQLKSAGSSGPARQQSTPPAPTVGSNRPRATRPTPAVAAAAHTATLRRTAGPVGPAALGSMVGSRGSASATGSSVAETTRLRTPYVPPGKTSSILLGPVPVPHSASVPWRGISLGMKTASPSSMEPHDTGSFAGAGNGSPIGLSMVASHIPLCWPEERETLDHSEYEAR